MKLNHLSLSTPYVQELAKFFVDHFDFVVTKKRPDGSIIALSCDEFDLVIAASVEAETIYPQGFHFGFIVDGLDQVQTAYDRLKLAGLNGVGEIARNERGAQFFFTAPGGITMELGCHRQERAD